MGILDFLKKMFPPGTNPLLGMEPQCVRYQYLTFRLPNGWKFTDADGRAFKASGPGDCLADFFFAGLINPAERSYKTNEFEKNRTAFVNVIGKYFLDGKGKAETILPTGVLWMEAADLQGERQRLRIALLNTRPRYTDLLPPMLQVTCTIPATGSAGVNTERFEALRAALRNIEWN